MRLTREQRRELTRRELLSAAEDVFAQQGYHAASVDEVAAAAGYTKGAVYSNFDSKEGLFLAVLEARMQTQIDMAAYLAEQAGAVPDGDLAALLPTLDWIDERWCLLVFEFWMHALRTPAVRDRLGTLYRQYRDKLAPLVSPYVGADVEPRELAATVIALYQGLALQRHVDPGAARSDLVARLFVMLRRGAQPDHDRVVIAPDHPTGGET